MSWWLERAAHWLQVSKADISSLDFIHPGFIHILKMEVGSKGKSFYIQPVLLRGDVQAHNATTQ